MAWISCVLNDLQQNHSNRHRRFKPPQLEVLWDSSDVTPTIEEKHGRPGMTYDDASGRRWVAFSRPPADFWDNLPRHDKTMATYLALHMRRFWREA